MFKRTLFTAIAALGATMSFATMHSSAAMTLAQPLLADPANGNVKIFSLMINPQGSDDGAEWFAVINTSTTTSYELSDVWFLSVDCETSQNGEVDNLQRLGSGGSFDQSRVIAPGQVIIFRDTDGGSPDAVEPDDPTNTVALNFNPEMSNSGCSYFLVRGKSAGLTTSSNLDDGGSGGTSNNDILDFAETSGTSDTEQWTETLDAVCIVRGSDADTNDTDVYWTTTANGGSLGLSTNALLLEVDKQALWTPDAFMRTKRTADSSWANGFICDTRTKNGSNEYEIQDGTGGGGEVREFTVANAANAGVSVNAAPTLLNDNVVPVGVKNVTNFSIGGNTYNHDD